jgi:hypothetical protein
LETTVSGCAHVASGMVDCVEVDIARLERSTHDLDGNVAGEKERVCEGHAGTTKCDLTQSSVIPE